MCWRAKIGSPSNNHCFALSYDTGGRSHPSPISRMLWVQSLPKKGPAQSHLSLERCLCEARWLRTTIPRSRSWCLAKTMGGLGVAMSS